MVLLGQMVKLQQHFCEKYVWKAGYKTGLLGTISNIIGELTEDSQLTTPESHTINKYLHKMVSLGITHCVMEVSSHSLVLDRVRGLDFDYAFVHKYYFGSFRFSSRFWKLTL